MSYKGFKMSNESKEKMRIAKLGKELSEDTKKKMGLSKKGKKFSKDAARRIRDGIRSKRYTQEYAKKLSLSKLGVTNHQAILNDSIIRKIRDEYNIALSKGHKKTAMQYVLADKYSVKRSTISDIVLNKTWKHVSNETEETKMIVNQKRTTTATEIANLLNNCFMLLRLEIEFNGSNFSLNLETDMAQVVYKENSKKGMNLFLNELKLLVNNKEDICELLDELNDLEFAS